MKQTLLKLFVIELLAILFLSGAAPFSAASPSRSRALGDEVGIQDDADTELPAGSDPLEKESDPLDMDKSNQEEAVAEEVDDDQKPGEKKKAKPKRGKEKDAADQMARDEALRARILKRLGDHEDGHFILVLKKTAIRSIAPTTVLPPNARRLGNKWREIVYQVEVIEGRAQAAEFVMAYAAFTQKPTEEKATYDWKLVNRVEDSKAAELELVKAKATANKKSVTRRPRTDIGMTFFYKDGPPKPFQGTRNKAAKKQQ